MFKREIIDTASKVIPNAGKIGVAVSGGGDSVFMLLVLKQGGHDIEAITVDHGLRPEAATEAEWVSELCKSIGVPHRIMRWTEHDDIRNVQGDARNARYDLIREWADERGISQVAIGHNEDDVAENWLIREQGILPVIERGGLVYFKPLLNFSREFIRNELRTAEQTWFDDPSNDDEHYARVKMRKKIRQNPDIREEALMNAKDHVRKVMNDSAVAREMIGHDVRVTRRGTVAINPESVVNQPEIAKVIIRAALRITGDLNPSIRGRSISRAVQSIADGKGFSLAGSIYDPKRAEFFREKGRAPITTMTDRGVWDGRWEIVLDGWDEVGAKSGTGPAVPFGYRKDLVSKRFLPDDTDLIRLMTPGVDESMDMSHRVHMPEPADDPDIGP